VSRGLGAVQRRILDQLASVPNIDAWTPIVDLACGTGRAEIESTRQSVRRLEAAGEVEATLVNRRSGHMLLAARLPWVRRQQIERLACMRDRLDVLTEERLAIRAIGYNGPLNDY
jgi:hypothetical protein